MKSSLGTRRWAPFIVGMIAGCRGGAYAQIEGGVFQVTDIDVAPRFFHAGSVLSQPIVMVTGGLGLRLLPPSLFSRHEVGFYELETRTFSDTFQPLNGDKPTRPRLLVARSSHAQTLLPDGRVLITGGNVSASGTDPGTPTDAVELFDPRIGRFVEGPPMSRPRAMHAAARLPDGRVVVAGGSDWQTFDPSSNTWSQAYPLARSRSAHASVLLPDFAGVAGDHRVLLIGGVGSGPDTMELLNPAEGTSRLLLSRLEIGMDDLAAVDLADGRVMICGGQNSGNGQTLAHAYFLDPVHDALVRVGDVPERVGGIADHQIVRRTRYVVIFGGEQEVGGEDTELNYVAIFDTWTETWFSWGAMTYPHDDFVSVKIGDCSVLLIGGGVPFLGQEAPSAFCEIFTLTLPDQCRAGDLNDDGAIDLKDHALFTPCLLGPAEANVPFDCHRADFDGNRKIDLIDAADFQAVFEGN